MDQDKIKAWWFDMVSNLTGQVMALSDEVKKLRERISDMSNDKSTNHADTHNVD